MYKISGTVKRLPRLAVDALLHVSVRSKDIANFVVECERLLAEEEDAHPKAEIVRQPNGGAYTSNPML